MKKAPRLGRLWAGRPWRGYGMTISRPRSWCSGSGCSARRTCIGSDASRHPWGCRPWSVFPPSSGWSIRRCWIPLMPEPSRSPGQAERPGPQGEVTSWEPPEGVVSGTTAEAAKRMACGAVRILSVLIWIPFAARALGQAPDHGPLQGGSRLTVAPGVQQSREVSSHRPSRFTASAWSFARKCCRLMRSSVVQVKTLTCEQPNPSLRLQH